MSWWLGIHYVFAAQKNCVEGKALGYKKWVPKKAQIETYHSFCGSLHKYITTCFDFTWKAMNKKFANCSPARHEVCQKKLHDPISGQNNTLFSLKKKQRKCINIGNLAVFWLSLNKMCNIFKCNEESLH